MPRPLDRVSTRTKARFAIALASASSLALASGVAAAQDTPDVDAIIRHGVELRQQGNDDAALAEFHRAYDVNHSARARAQMALAEQALGRWVDAEAHLTEALAAAQDPWIARNATALRSALDTIARHLGSLEVRANVPGAEVWINGERRGTLPMDQPARVVTGTIEVEVRANGYNTVRRNVDVEPGVRSRETFRLVSLSASTGTDTNTGNGGATSSEAPSSESPTSTAASGALNGTQPVPPPPETQQPGGNGLAPAVVTAVGVVVLAGSAVFYGLRASAIGNCTQTGDTLYCPTQADADRAAGGGTDNVVGNVLLVTGAVITLGGLAWMLVPRLMHSSEHRAMLNVTPTDRGVFLGLQGSF